MVKLKNPVPQGEWVDMSASVPDAAAEKPPESKADRYRRLVHARVPRAVRAIEALGNLSVKGQYEYTPTQAEKLVAALQNAVNGVVHRFAGSVPVERTFDLD